MDAELFNGNAESLRRKAWQCVIGVCMAALRRFISFYYISAH